MTNYDLTYEGSRVQGILDTGNSLKDAGYIFRGEATPSTVPGTPTERVAYIGGPGTYNNFGGSITVGAGCICVFKYTGSAWSNQVINTGLSDAISSEATTRSEADTALQSAINSEATTRSEADTALQNAINAINNNIGNGYVFAGVAIPSTSPVTGKVFYLAVQAGTYTNFEDSEETPLTVTAGINILKNTGTGWVLDQVIAIDAEPTQGSDNLVKSGGVLNSIIQNGPAFDLSAYNAQEGVLATYADLNAALTALNTLPADFKKGGMSFKFVQSSDNKYIQVRCMAQNFTTDVTQWQGVDETPTAGSQNLVKSGGVKDLISIHDVSIENINHILGVANDCLEGYVINSSNKWASGNSDCYIIPIQPSDTIVMERTGTFIYALLSNFKSVKSGDTPYFCSGTQRVNANGTVQITAPQDAKYLYLLKRSSNIVYGVKTTINGKEFDLYSQIKNNKENIVKLNEDIEDFSEEVSSIIGIRRNYVPGYTDWTLRSGSTATLTEDTAIYEIDTQLLTFVKIPIANDFHIGDNVYAALWDVNPSTTVNFQLRYYNAQNEELTEYRESVALFKTDFIKISGNIPENTSYFNVILVNTISAEATLTLGKCVLSKADLDVNSQFSRTSPTGMDKIQEDVMELQENISKVPKDIYPDAYLYKKEIPAYFFTKEAPTSFDIDYLDSQIKNIPEGKHTIFITDTHWDKNQKHSIDLIQYIRGKIGNVCVVYGGDSITADEDKYYAAKEMYDFFNRCISSLGNKFLPIVGNHDTNMAGASTLDVPTKYLPFDQLKKIGFDAIPNDAVRYTVTDTELQPYSDSAAVRAELIEYFKLTYYWDDIANKTRYIFVNTGNPARGTVYDVFGVSSRTEVMLAIKFIYQAMLTTPAGYDVILTGHMIIGYTMSSGSEVFDKVRVIKLLLNMLSSLKSHGTTSFDQTSISTTTNGWVESGNVTYDFTTSNNVGKIIVLAGHYHLDATFVHRPGDNPDASDEVDWLGETINQSSNYRIPILLTTTDASEASAYPTIPESRRVPMENGTITEQAFDIVTLTQTGVVTTRIGAGNSRNIPIS